MINKIRNILSTCILCLSLGLNSCDFINPPEDIPSFIKVDTFKIKITDPTQGSSSHNLTDVWISIDGNKAGMFELPVILPILGDGPTNIVLRPGIIHNGQIFSRLIHPYLNPYIIDTILIEDQIIQLEPVITYKEECKFAWTEDFERTGFNLNTTNSDTSIVLISKNVLEGNYAGGIFLSGDNIYFEGQSPPIDVPRSKDILLLEFFYKNNYNFEVGVITNISAYEYIVHLSPRENWDKISLNIDNLVFGYPGATQFVVCIRALVTTSGLSAEIFIDNIKLTHYK